MKKALVAALFIGASFLVGPPAQAQDAAERAGELKAWREQCSDPDVDLRTAYIEAAIATEDVAVVRICIRPSLDSDDADIRNLGLRAALASIEQLSFEVRMPDDLAAAYKKAGDDADALRKVNDTYAARDWNSLKTGLVVAIDEADIARGTSVWSPLVNLQKKEQNISGKASIIGSQLNWIGRAYLSQDNCHLDLELVAGGKLDGTLQCQDNMAFHVSAALL